MNQAASEPTQTPTTPAPTTDAAPAPAKPEGEAAPEGDKSLLNKDAKDTKAPEGVPEKYEFKAPEGFEIDPKTVDEITPIFKELGLPQAGAQKLVDFYAAKLKETAEAPYKAYTDMRDGWRKENIANPELGDGKDNLRPEVRKATSDLINSLGPDLASKFREAMDLTGAGDHPAFVKAFTQFAKRFGEGSAVRGSGPSPAGQTAPHAPPPSAAKALYPNLP